MRIYLKTRILLAFGKMLPLDPVGPEEVAVWFNAANRAFEILRSMILRAEEWGLRNRSSEGQHYRMAGLNLLAAIIIYWNTVRLDKAVQQGPCVREERSVPIRLMQTPTTCRMLRRERGYAGVADRHRRLEWLWQLGDTRP